MIQITLHITDIGSCTRCQIQSFMVWWTNITQKDLKEHIHAEAIANVFEQCYSKNMHGTMVTKQTACFLENKLIETR